MSDNKEVVRKCGLASIPFYRGIGCWKSTTRPYPEDKPI